MAAYIIVDVEVTDLEAYEGYRRLVGPTLEKYGGRFIVRGGSHETLEGDWKPNRLVVLEFESVERAREWYDSEEYAPAREIRFRAARSNLIIVEGA